MDTTYRIVRMYFNDDQPSREIDNGLTLEEAQAHCRDPETSSRTCSDGAEEAERGPWFDGFEEE